MDLVFDVDDLIWAKFQHYRPWPGRISRKTINLKEGEVWVQFYGKDDYSNVSLHNVFPYLDNVDEFTASLPKELKSSFYTAINTIHEKYWNLVDLKRDANDSGFPLDIEEKIQHAIEDRKAHYWNPHVLMRPIPEILDDSDDDDYYPSPEWGKSKNKKFKKDDEGASTKAIGKKISKRTRSKTETKSKVSTSGQRSKALTSGLSSKASTSDLSSKASTSGLSCKASTSGLSCKASTSGLSSKASTSGLSSKASTSGLSCKASTSGLSKGKTSSPSVTFPATKRQKIIYLNRLSAQEAAVQNIEEVNPRKRKSSEKEDTADQNIGTKKRNSGVTLSEEYARPTSKAGCSTDFSNETIAPEIRISPFQHLSIPVPPGSEIAVPQNNCADCKIRYGFIGLKQLSQSIIYPLLKYKHTVNVWSKDASKFNALTKAGAVRTNKPATIITSSDVIFFSTGDTDVSKNILLTREGVFDGCERSRDIPKIFVELTNIDVFEPDMNIRPLIQFQGGFYLQVKVVTPQIDKKAPLTFICAGDKRVFAAVVSCLYNVSDDVHYFGSEFFKDAPMKLTPRMAEELVLQSLQKTTSVLYELGFHIPDFEKILCQEGFNFRRVAAKLREYNRAERNKPIKFYQDM